MPIKIDELYYELNVRTDQLKNSTTEARNLLEKLGASVTPVSAGITAAGVAIGALGIAAAKAAAQVDSSFRRISGILPEFAENTKRAREEITAIATTTGRSMTELLAASEAIAKGGVANTSELLQRLNLASKLADATSTDLIRVADGLDQVTEVFGIQAGKVEETAGKLFRLAQGGESLEGIFSALAASAPAIRDAGLDFDTASRALLSLVTQGRRARQAASELDQLAKQGKTGAEEIKKLAEAVDFAGNEMTQLDTAAANVAGGADRAGARIRESLNAELIRLGDIILPFILKQLEGLVGLLDKLRGEDDKIKALADVATVNTLTTVRRKGQELSAEDQGRLGTAIGSITRAFSDEEIDFATLPLKELERLQQGFQQFAKDADYRSLLFSDTFKAITAALVEQRVALMKSVEAGKEAGTQSAKTAEQLIAEQKAIDDAKDAATDAAEARQRAADKEKAAIREINTALARFTTTAVDDLKEALRQQEEDFKDTYGENLPAAAKELLTKLKAQIESVKLLEPLQEQFRELGPEIDNALKLAERGYADALVGDGGILAKTEELLANAKARVAEEQKGTKEYEDALALVTQIEAKWELILAAITAAGGVVGQTNTDLQKSRERIATMAATIQGAARGALQLADAFGLVDDNVAKTLETLVEVGTSIPAFTNELDALQKGTGSITAVVGAALPIVGGLASLASSLLGGGQSPEEKRREEILQENNTVIRDLTRSIGELGTVLEDVSGSRIAGVTEAVSGFLGGNTGIGGFLNVFELKKDLASLGLTIDDVREVADGLGIKFAGTIPTLKELTQLAEALAEAELTRFAQTFGGQLEALRLQFELFDLTDPIDQLKLLQQLATGEFGAGGAGEAFAQLRNLDLSSTAGRKAADALIQSLFEQLQQGTLTPGQLGGLSTQQFLQMLQEFERLIDSIEQQQEDGGETQQFGEDRTVTEVTALRQVSIMLTQVEYLRQIAENTTGFRLGADGVAPTGTMIGALEVNVTVPAGVENPVELGQAVGGAVVTEVNRLLGDQYQKSLATSGVVVRS